MCPNLKTYCEMHYAELPVFKEAYDLVLEVYRSSPTMQREYRYTLGEEIKKEIVQLLFCVYRANMTRQKAPYIRQARECIELVRLRFRLLHDLKQLPVRQMARMNLRIEEISKQLAAWHKSALEKKKQEADPKRELA